MLCSGSCKEHCPHQEHKRYRHSYLLQSSFRSYQELPHDHLSYIHIHALPHLLQLRMHRSYGLQNVHLQHH